MAHSATFLLVALCAFGIGRSTDSASAQEAVEVPPAVVEVESRTRRADAGTRLASSSAAVLVVDPKPAASEASDLGAILTRQQGVNLQRGGGLGAPTRLSLQGLGEDQIRFTIDGVPLAFTGLPESVAYVPVELVSRLEIYRGVVPIRLGGDTLGGAIQLISPSPEPGLHLQSSLTLGAFDTQRGVLRAQVVDPKTGLYVIGSSFLDHARNDYAMDDVPVTQPDGKLAPSRVYRLHDGYRAGYGQVEVGLVDRPYAKRLAVRGFVSGYDKQINHDLLMNNPYGDVLSRRRAQGALLLYEYAQGRRVSLEGKLGYAHRTRGLRDLGKCAYDWARRCIAPLPNGGEIFGLPTDRQTDEDDLFLRAHASYRASPLLQLRASVAPTYVRSTSRDAAATAGIPDLFAQSRSLLGLMLGLEYELDAFESRLENVLFFKDYVQKQWADVTTTRGTEHPSLTRHRIGVGNAARVRLLDSLIGKVSYELGARLPDGNEVFGDGAFVEANLGLRAETSHNLNLELRWSVEEERIGAATLTATGFFRHVSDFIFLLPGPTVAQYQNLTTAQVKGVEASARYESPGRYVFVEGNVTWQDMRNRARTGPFAMFDGERIPNRPYLFANLSVGGRVRELAVEQDALSLVFRQRYVGEFFRAFEVRSAEERAGVPRQLVSSLALVYEVTASTRAVGASVELDNLTNAAVYDFFGVQRPGRYALGKLTLRL